MEFFSTKVECLSEIVLEHIQPADTEKHEFEERHVSKNWLISGILQGRESTVFPKNFSIGLKLSIEELIERIEQMFREKTWLSKFSRHIGTFMVLPVTQLSGAKHKCKFFYWHTPWQK